MQMLPTKGSTAVEQLGLSEDALRGQVAVVTGAGRGIGRETARAFARLGAKVIIAEISEAGLETERLIRQAGGQALFVPVDISQREEVQALVQRTQEAFGTAAILVNNAILCPVAPVLEMDVDLWDRVMAVNLRGTFLTCQAFLPGMLAQKQGTIINMTSTDAMPNLSAYIASKQGIAAFSQSLAAEVVQDGVRVIAFTPGFVDTPGLREAAQGLAPAFGMSAESFLKMPMHAAYTENAMPADHAAAAAVYLAVALAEEYHGEQVNGYTVLERAGFLQTKDRPAGTAAGRSSRPDGAQPNERPVDQAVSLSQGLQKVLVETAAEFGQLPIFVRPLARAGFKNKSGQSLQDWTHTVEALAAQLSEAGKAFSSGGAVQVPAQAKVRGMLGKLAVYYAEVPEETGRFTRDAALLQKIQQISEERVALIQSLAAALDALCEANRF